MTRARALLPLIALSLVGLLPGVPRAASLDEPMTFSLHDECEGSGCDSYILARGRIVASTAHDFEVFAGKIRHQPSVYLHSAGGDLLGGLGLGRAIRKAGLDTYVGGPYEEVVRVDEPYRTLVAEAICYSACAYAFMGGVIRRVGERGKLGVHQFRGAQKDVGEASAQLTVAALAEYLDEMGIERRLLDAASATESRRIRVLSAATLRSLNVDNTDPPKARWRLEAAPDGRVALLSSQRQATRDGTLHVALFRDGVRFIAYLRYAIRQNFRSEAEMIEIFSGRTDFEIRIPRGGSFAGVPVAAWTRTPAGFDIALSVPRSAVLAISEADSFDLKADWNNATRDVDPSTTFGTAGFRNGAAVLLRR